MIASGTRLSDEQAMFLESVDRLARDRVEPVAPEIDVAAEIPRELVRLLVDTELLAIDTPVEQGGGGGDTGMLALMLRRLAAASGAVAAVAGAGHVYAAAWRAADAPDDARLSGVSEGRWGTIVEGRRTPVEASRFAGGVRLSGTAEAVEAGEFAAGALVIARLDGGAPIVAEVPIADLSWSSVQPRAGLRGLRSAGVRLDGVAAETVLGGAEVLAALRRHMRLAAAACAVGVADAALTRARSYMSERRQFGRLLSEFAGLQAIVTRSEDRILAAEGLLVSAATMPVGSREGPAAAVRACRVAGPAAVAVCADAIQLHGGYGYIAEYGVERLMRDAISARARTIAAVLRRAE